MVASTCLVAGCGAPVAYHVKTNVPWPDEWAAGPRAPYSRELSVAAGTVAWHRDADVHRLAADVERRIAGESSIFGFARVDYARKVADPSKPDRKALPFVEVRIVPVWLLSTDGLSAGSLDESTTIRDAVEHLAREMHRTVAWPDSSRLNERCGPIPGGDARAVLMQLLLEHDLFIRCECGPPDVMRSLEFRDEKDFLAAIGAVARRSARRDIEGPIEVMHLRDWIIDYVNRVCGGAEAAPVMIAKRSVGLLSERDVTDAVVADVKQQLLATLEYHVR